MTKKLSFSFSFILIASALLYILAFPFSAAYHARSAVKMCAVSIVPTLFTFMVLSRMLSHICVQKSFTGKFTMFLSRLFNLPCCLIPICLSGFICGAPSGAFAICRMCDEGHCTNDQAERACILSNNCSAAFILGFISALLGSRLSALYIFISNILATVTVYLIFFRKGESDNKTNIKQTNIGESFSEIITESISSSVTSTAALCGYVVLFYTFTQIICERLGFILNIFNVSEGYTGFINTCVSSFFELSSGVLRAAQTGGNLSVVLCSGAAAFTGVSIIFQVLGIMTKSGIQAKSFILSKCLCAFLCPIFTVLMMLFSPAAVDVFASSENSYGVTVSDIGVLVFVTATAFIGAYILMQLDKKHKK